MEIIYEEKERSDVVTMAAEQNIENLIQLWKTIGHKTHELASGDRLNYSKSWPNRLWLDWQSEEKCLNSVLEFSQTTKRHFSVPLWPDGRQNISRSHSFLLDNNYYVSMRQCSMRKAVDNTKATTLNDSIRIIPVVTDRQAELWSTCISQSFGYTVDPSVIRLIYSLDKLTFYLVYDGCNQIVSAFLLFEHRNSVGLHYLGVLPDHQKQGIASNIINGIFSICRKNKYKYLDLQSSPAGLRLYNKMGFQSLVSYNNYIQK